MKTPIAFLVRHRNALLFLFAMGFGLLAAFGARGYISQQIAVERERLVPRQQMARVVVAKRNLVRGDPVDETSMAVRDIPAQYLPTGVVRPDQFSRYAGARLTAAMRAGEPLLSASLEGVDPSTFSAKVRDGIRAVTVTVDEVNSISGMLQPGDRIDLLLSASLPGSAGASLPKEVTRPLMQDLRVLATGRRVHPGQPERDSRAFTTITVEVSPEQAQKLVVAQRVGKLTAMLRNPKDRGRIDSRVMDVYGLLGVTPAPAPERAPVLHSTEVITGGQRPLVSRSASGANRAPEVLLDTPSEKPASSTDAASPLEPKRASLTPDAPLLRRPGASR